jgi:ketosteroid isomerase-like protein
MNGAEMRNTEIALALFRSIKDDDLDSVADHFAHDAAWTELPLGVTYHGPSGWRKNVEYWREAFVNGRAEVSNVIDAGDTVVVEYVGSGQHTGTLATPDGPLPPTARCIRAHIVDVWEFEDGKIKRGRSYVGGLVAGMTGPARPS